MPGFNGIGPVGFGPMTGWGRGFCIEPGWKGYPRYGWAGEYGRGWRHCFWATEVPGRICRWPRYDYPYFTAEEEREWLKQEAQFLESELEGIRKRMAELDRKSTEKKAEK